MSFIKIGESYYNVAEITVITLRQVHFDKDEKTVAKLDLASGKSIYIAESDLSIIFELTGNSNPPEIQMIEMPVMSAN